MRKIALVSAACVAFAACAPLNAPITATGTVGAKPSSFTAGLIDADFNLQGAIGVGALNKNDALAQCVHGLVPPPAVPGAAPPASFTPRTGSIEADAAVLYIRAEQAKATASADLTNAQTNCDALVGAFIRKAVTGATNTLLPLPIKL